MMSSITVVSCHAEDVMAGRSGRCADAPRVSSLRELRTVLEETIVDATPRRCLDLIGHSTREARLLRLGATVIDLLDPAIDGFFRALARDRVLSRLDVVALRLLGCETAVLPTGQRTIRTLSHVLGIPVFGTRKIIMKGHYDERGFNPAFSSVLIESAQLPNPPQRLT